MPRAGDQKSYFFIAKAQNEQGVLEAIQWKILFVQEFFFSRHVLFYLSVLFYVNLHVKHVIHHTQLKQRVGVLTTLKENFTSTWLFH